MIAVQFIAIAVIGYLMGAIPFGLIIAKLFANIDITRHGSGNIGGTNVLRILGLGPGALVAVLDLAKGFAAVVIARAILGGIPLFFIGFPPQLSFLQIGAEVLAAMMAMIGHNWSVYIKFRGGKGVAAYFGGWLALLPLVALLGGAIIIIVVAFTRLMSRASIIGALSTVCALIIFTVFYGISPLYLIYSVLASAIIVYQHRVNIVRLQTGTELKLDDKVFNKPKKTKVP